MKTKILLLGIMLCGGLMAGDYRLLLGNDVFLIEFNSTDRKIVDAPRYLTIVDKDIFLINQHEHLVYGKRVVEGGQPNWFVLNLESKHTQIFLDKETMLIHLKEIGINDPEEPVKPLDFYKARSVSTGK